MTTLAPKELAARFHHKLVLIHSFPNVNGRHSRIITDAVLKKLMDKPAIAWAGGYQLETLNERRDECIKALKKADGHEFSALLKFVGL